MPFSILNDVSKKLHERACVATRRCALSEAFSMKAPIEAWGQRLSDALRVALASGDLPLAVRLAEEGDGQSRSLAAEYSFMVRGLGVTLNVLVHLLVETADRDKSSERAAAAAELTALLRNFCDSLIKTVAGSEIAATPMARALSLFEERERVLRILVEVQDRFERDQSQRAEAVVRAINAGDIAGARRLIDAKEQGAYLPYHDELIRFMADSFAWILRRYGPDELLRFHLATAEGQRAGFEKWEKMSAAEFAWVSAFLLKQHMGAVAVREDGERFTIDQSPCGSGGRLQLGGAYAGAAALPFVETTGALTFGEPRIPVYCSHCAIWNGLATLRWFGRAHWVFERPARADGGCTLHIYKRREDAPVQYQQRLGFHREG